MKFALCGSCVWIIVRSILRIYGHQRFRNKILDELYTLRSKLLFKHNRPIVENETFRQIWQASKQLTKVNSPESHPHPKSASSRTGASRAIDEFSRLNGYKQYVVSLSTRDDNEDGCHEIVQPKDILHRPRRDEVTESHIIKMVDVDYYLDMAHWISYGRPLILYTFNPTEVAYSGDEYEYKISGDRVKMRVAGGTTYDHELWDYNNDYIVTRTGWFDWVVSSVDVRRIDDHHNVVCIVPVSRTWFWGWLLPQSQLKRRTFGHAGGVVITRFQDNGVDMMSLKLENKTTHVTLKTSYFEAAAVRVSDSKNPVISDIERYLQKAEHPEPHIGGAILFDILINYPKLKNLEWKVPRATDAKTQNHYQATPVAGLVTEDGKEIGRTLCEPLVAHPDVIPNRSYNNDLMCIMGRVTSQMNDVTPPARYVKWVDDFVRELIPTSHRGVPISADEVIVLQDRVTQRARSDKIRPWMMADPAIMLRSFMKGESYSKISDPRNITTVGTEHTILLSQYTYAFKRDVLYHLDWYMPGKTPRQIAQRVVDICQEYDKVTEGDFSRFDGTISLWLREQLEQAAYLRWCNRDDGVLLQKLLKNEIGAKAWTSQGLPYEPKHSRLSGSPLTTDSNTMICAFVAYSAGREAGLSHETSWSLLGAFCGDDSLSPVKGVFLEKSSKMLGMKLKAEVRQRHDIVTFLGRVFPSAFEGGLGSVQDPERTWRKLHISFAQPYVSNDQALADKATGLLTLDPNSPIVSTWCRKVLEWSSQKNIQGSVTDDAPWFARNYAAIGETWPQCEWDNAVEAIARRTGFYASDIQDWDHKIESARDIVDLANLIPNNATTVSIPAVMNGTLYEPDAAPPSVTNTLPVTRRRDHRTKASGRENDTMQRPAHHVARTRTNQRFSPGHSHQRRPRGA